MRILAEIGNFFRTLFRLLAQRTNNPPPPAAPPLSRARRMAITQQIEIGSAGASATTRGAEAGASSLSPPAPVAADVADDLSGRTQTMRGGASRRPAHPAPRAPAHYLPEVVSEDDAERVALGVASSPPEAIRRLPAVPVPASSPATAGAGLGGAVTNHSAASSAGATAVAVHSHTTFTEEQATHLPPTAPKGPSRRRISIFSSKLPESTTDTATHTGPAIGMIPAGTSEV